MSLTVVTKLSLPMGENALILIIYCFAYEEKKLFQPMKKGSDFCTK